jgi:hypothetical protein
VWAAYKKGALASMGADFADGGDGRGRLQGGLRGEIVAATTRLDPVRRDDVLATGRSAWRSASGRMPDTEKAPFMLLGDMVWFPWASPRNRVAAAVNFFNAIRDQIPMMDMGVLPKDHRFFDVLCAHGVMRRVGTSQLVYRDQPAAVYETRRRTTS